MKRSDDKLSSLFKWIMIVISGFGVIALVLLGITIIVSVFWRYALNRPIFGAEDIAVMCLTVVVASAIADAGRHNGHITIDLLPRCGNPAIEKTRVIIVAFVNIGVTITLAIALFNAGLCGRQCGAVTSNISIPHAPFYFYLSIALIANSICFIVAAMRQWKHPMHSIHSEKNTNSETF